MNITLIRSFLKFNHFAGFDEKQAMAIKDIVQEVLHSSIDHQTKVLVTKAQLVGTWSILIIDTSDRWIHEMQIFTLLVNNPVIKNELYLIFRRLQPNK